MSIRQWLKQNYLIVLLFVASTAFFLYQHTTGISWDFSVYVMNAKYWLGAGGYYEWTRPPLASALIGLFSWLGWLVAEYLYIAFVSTIFAFASIKLSKKLKINKNLFYVLLLSPFVLGAGLSEGTELLSLALLMLLFVYVDTFKAGVFLGLLCLTKYVYIGFFPLLFLSVRKKGNWKKILCGLCIVILIVSVWLLFNRYVTGSAWTSMADSYALTVFFRGYINQPVNPVHFLTALTYYLPLLLVGLFIAVKLKFKKYDWAMLFVFCFIVYCYISAPVKVSRYLFLLVLPTAFFVSKIWTKIKLRRRHIAAIVIANFVLLMFLFGPLTNAEYFDVEADGAIMSNSWAPMSYVKDQVVEPFPYADVVHNEMAKGKRLVVYKVPGDEIWDNKELLANLPVIRETDGYVVYGYSNITASTPVETWDKPYLIRYKERTGVYYSPCEILWPDSWCG